MELELSPARASMGQWLMALGVMWGSGPGQAVESRGSARKGHTRGVGVPVQKILCTLCPNKDYLPSPTARIFNVKTIQKIQTKSFLSGIFYFLRMQMFH